MIKMIRTKLYTLLFLLAAATVFGQQKQVQASIDSTKIKIGSQFNLTLKATVDTAARVNFPEGKNFGRLEVLESYPVDTVKNGAIYELVKKYGLTQFDSGRYVIPRLPVVINNKTTYTDSLKIEVNNIKVDTLKQKMYDIKPVIAGRSDVAFWLWVLLAIVLAGAAGFGIWWCLKKRKNKAPKAKEEVLISPIDKAKAHLDSLEQKELLQKGAIKDYYSELADIARTYIEEAIHIPAMESTTGELIEAMQAAVKRRKMSLNAEIFEQLENVLRSADMVKFAKSRPLDFEIAEDRNRIEKTIVVIDRSIPEEKDDDDLHTQIWLEAQRKKKAKKRRNLIVSLCVASVMAVAVASMITYGTEYLKDNIFGHPTKELLEGEWVKSEYGNPGVRVETPKVLKRVDATDKIPQAAKAGIKEMQMFAYGAMYDNFYVMVSTTKFTKPIDADLKVALDGAIKTMEAQGAKNILVQSEEFSTEKGIQGLRAYGNMSLPDPITKKLVRAYYEVLYFKQQQGLQQVMILHQEGDEYAMEILERIKNSVELRVN
jgi:flagellar basal body-associated protein FliL